MFMSPQHAVNLGRDAYHDGKHENPFPFGITYHHDWLYGYNIEDTYEEWYAEDSDWDDQEEDYEADYLDWEIEPDEIDANDFDIPDK